MIETAISNIRRIIWIIMRTLINKKDKEFPVFPKRVKRRCPAIILAVNRTANVPGRIKLLIVSIHTIKGMRIEGVPWGTRWVNICCRLLIQPYSINESQNGSAIDRVIVKWLVEVKVYGKDQKNY